MKEKEIEIKGCNSIAELITKVIHAERILNRNPNKMILSKELATRLVFEYDEFGKWNQDGKPLWKRCVGSSYMGMAVEVVANKSFDYIELFEIEK